MYREEYTNDIPSRDTLTAGTCPVQWALSVASAAREASDGKNVMGRDGMTQLKQILTDLTTGSAEDDDLELVRDICQVIITTPGCEHSSKAAEDILWSLENNFMDWNNHRRKKCANGVCWENPVAAAAAGEGRQRRRRRGGGGSSEE